MRIWELNAYILDLKLKSQIPVNIAFSEHNAADFGRPLVTRVLAVLARWKGEKGRQGSIYQRWGRNKAALPSSEDQADGYCLHSGPASTASSLDYQPHNALRR